MLEVHIYKQTKRTRDQLFTLTIPSRLSHKYTELVKLIDTKFPQKQGFIVEIEEFTMVSRPYAPAPEEATQPATEAEQLTIDGG